MNKIVLLLLLFIVLVSKAKASDSCQIFLNDHVIYQGSVEQEGATAKLNTRRFKKADLITIKYYSENPEKGWKRTFYFYEENNNDIKKVELGKQTGSVSVSASVLNVIAEKKQPVFIYTTSLPTDKAMAARIRVRRMFICKIEWN